MQSLRLAPDFYGSQNLMRFCLVLIIQFGVLFSPISLVYSDSGFSYFNENYGISPVTDLESGKKLPKDESHENVLCWSSVNKDGLCYSLIKASLMSYKECCGDGQASTGFSKKAVEPGRLFYLKALRKGVPCKRCKESCEGVECGMDKSCVFKANVGPKCVCKANCTRRKRKLGKVCGLDGRTYKNICHLNRRKCQKEGSLLVDYYGSCKDSCDKVKCSEGSSCLLDQNSRPHCVECKRDCPKVVDGHVCGMDNKTYPSLCVLRQISCLAGKNIAVQHHGRCLNESLPTETS